MITDLDKYKIIERRKAECREKIEFHTKNVILQSMISLMCLMGGTYAGNKKSIWVPLIIAPIAGASISNLSKHESKRQAYIKVLKKLEKE